MGTNASLLTIYTSHVMRLRLGAVGIICDSRLITTRTQHLLSIQLDYYPAQDSDLEPAFIVPAFRLDLVHHEYRHSEERTRST